jgi:HK97 family phage prohead protease
MKMNKIFNLTSQFKAHEEDDGTVKIRGYASTNDEDRAGDVIEATAWEKGGLTNYKNNPIILFNHNYNEPIGKVTDLTTTDKGLEISGLISKSAGKIRDMVKEGVLGAFSVGFRVKDADYVEETDGLRIKDAELFEVSVVSVPANQAAIFSVAKSFDSEEDYAVWKAQFINDPQMKPGQSVKDSPTETANAVFEEKIMSDQKDFNLEEFAKEVARKTATEIAMAQAKRDVDKQAAIEEAKIASEAEQATKDAELDKRKAEVQAVVQGVTTGAERLINDVEERVSKNHENLEAVVNELRSELKEKSEEIQHIRESKRIFSDRGNNSDWKVAFKNEMADAYILARTTGKGYDTDFGRNVFEKVNAHSGVQVSSADFEQEVSSNIERDIQLELVLAPLFREIQMRSATQILPIMPDAGYAEFTANQAASGSSPHGNLAERGDAYGTPWGGADLTERTLSTKKLISQSYLGNETEEDAIIPVLPLIREAVIRSHARAVEAMILVGNSADGPFGTSGASPDGIITLAAADSDKTQSGTAFASEALTAAQLLAARKNMGKYGVRPSDVVYIVNLTEYHNLIADSAYADSSQVEGLATKLTGQVGQVYGSAVIVSDEFATPAVAKYYAVAVNARNFVIPRLRGITVESDYEVANQRRVLVASQRIGFTDIIDGATNKWALQYKAS